VLARIQPVMGRLIPGSFKEMLPVARGRGERIRCMLTVGKERVVGWGASKWSRAITVLVGKLVQSEGRQTIRMELTK